MVEIAVVSKDSYAMRFNKGTPQWKELSDTLINDYLESGCTVNKYNEILNEDGEVVVRYNEILNEDGEVVVRYCENDDEVLFEVIKPKETI